MESSLKAGLDVDWVSIALVGGTLKIYISLNVKVPMWKREQLFSGLLSSLGLNLISVRGWRRVPSRFLSLLFGDRGYVSGIPLLVLLREFRRQGKGRLHIDFFLTFNSSFPFLREAIKNILLRYVQGDFGFFIGRAKSGDKYFVCLTLGYGLNTSSLWVFDRIFKGRAMLGAPSVKCVKGPAHYIEYMKKNCIPSSFVAYERGLCGKNL